MGKKKQLDARKQDKKLLVLDLDETLVHSRFETFGEEADFSFTLVDGGAIYHVKLRPGVRSFLQRVAGLFDVMVFTASDKEYADKVIDFLDPTRALISRRAYLDSGIDLPKSQGGYVKDLSVFAHDLAQIAIIDNCPHNYRLQKNNGIPITSWYVDPNDRELASLLPFLEGLVAVEDVRPIITERFGCFNGVSSKKKKNVVIAAESLVKPMQNLSCKGQPSVQPKVQKKSSSCQVTR